MVTWRAKRFRACHRSPATRAGPNFWPRTGRPSSCRPPSWPASPGESVRTFCSLDEQREGRTPPSTPTLLRQSVSSLYGCKGSLHHMYCTLYYIQYIYYIYFYSGIIRLPKATKTPMKNKVIPRPSLANIVKDLGMARTNSNWMCFAFHLSCLCWPLFLCAAISAPLKLKASRGPPTPINRNQANQPRVGQSLLGKRGFDSVRIHRAYTKSFCSL